MTLKPRKAKATKSRKKIKRHGDEKKTDFFSTNYGKAKYGRYAGMQISLLVSTRISGMNVENSMGLEDGARRGRPQREFSYYLLFSAKYKLRAPHSEAATKRFSHFFSENLFFYRQQRRRRRHRSEAYLCYLSHFKKCFSSTVTTEKSLFFEIIILCPVVLLLLHPGCRRPNPIETLHEKTENRILLAPNRFPY